MSVAQTTLRDFAKEYEWTTEPFVKTVIFDLRQPTARKSKRLEAAIESANEIKTETARRMPSVPKQTWGVAKPANSVWYAWAKEFDTHLSNKTVHENIQSIRETFESWRKRGYDGDRPSAEQFLDADACSFYYAQPLYKTHGGREYLSLPLAAGRGERELLPLYENEYATEYIERIQANEVTTGRGTLVRTGEEYRFHQAIREDIEVIANPQTMIGVDVGLSNLAVAAAVGDGTKQGAELWSGNEAAEMRNRFNERKRLAQQEQDVQRIRDEEARYTEHICHVVSREVIEWALDHDRPKILLEDLTHIRQTFIRRKREHTAEERRVLHSWPFRKLQGMIEYKATEAGIPYEYIDPRNTSRCCNECGHTAEENRRGIHFECVSCGYQVNADVNGAFNIATK